jgi:hypothetical protein
MITTYTAFISISIVPVVLAATLSPARSSAPFSDRDWAFVLFYVSHMIFVLPIITIFTLSAAVTQIMEVRRRRDPAALSVHALAAQVVVYVLLGLYWLWRFGYFWYQLAGWPMVNNILYAAA